MKAIVLIIFLMLSTICVAQYSSGSFPPRDYLTIDGRLLDINVYFKLEYRGRPSVYYDFMVYAGSTFQFRPHFRNKLIRVIVYQSDGVEIPVNPSDSPTPPQRIQIDSNHYILCDVNQNNDPTDGIRAIQMESTTGEEDE